MNVELIRKLYFDSIAECEKEGSNEAWVWERNFTKAVVKECARVAWRNTPDYEELGYGNLIQDKILERFGIDK